jgi:hypothetical protein
MPWIAALAALTLASCDEEFIDPGIGGSQTALFRAEAYVAWAKLAACGGDTALMGLLAPDILAFDSLPITDGRESAIAIGGNLHLGDVLGARSCDDVLAGINYAEMPVTCAPGGAPACDGDAVRSCEAFGDDDYQVVTDCARFDMTCHDGACRMPACAGAACDGDVLVTCGDDGRQVRFDCGALGLSCGHGGEGLQCVGAGEACSVKKDANDELGIEPHCEEFKLVWCLGGREARVNCAGLTDGRRQCSYGWLSSNPEVAPDDILSKYLAKACGPAAFDCEDGLMLCDGRDLKICIDGFFEYLDCRAYGFEECRVEGGQARCAGFPRS